MYRETGTPLTSTPHTSSLTPETRCEGDAEEIAQPFPPVSATEHAALNANEDPITDWIEELSPTIQP